MATMSKEMNVMKKEDVLSKAQKEGMLGIDEGTKQMKNHGRLIGQAMFSLVFVIIAFLAIITKNKIDYGVRAMFLAYRSSVDRLYPSLHPILQKYLYLIP